MESPPPGHRAPNTTNVLTLLLGVALVVAVVLLVISLKPAGSGPAFSVTAINADACPVGEGAPACFQVLVENSGSEAAHVRCELTPAEGTTALFFSGMSSTRAPRRSTRNRCCRSRSRST